MTGNVVSMDLSLPNIWHSWWKFRKGKKHSLAIEDFSYHLEENLFRLWEELTNGSYRHGGYKVFYVTDNKKRRIAVANIRDRVAHRLLYEYLVPIFDPTFIFDAWSCRKGKGLLGAIHRTQELLHSYSRSFVWRADVVKFFDSIDRDILFGLLEKEVHDAQARALIKEVIDSSCAVERERERERDAMPPNGIPIGNLTSQVFANIYLNEFDQFVTTILRPQGYVRYGDDFIIIGATKELIEEMRKRATDFFHTNLRLALHRKNNVVVRARHGLHFLGMRIFPNGRTLNARNLSRIENRLTIENSASYSGLVRHHMNGKYRKVFQWVLLQKLINEL